MRFFGEDADIKKMLTSICLTAEHIGFMEGNNQDEYKILELRDVLVDMKEDLFTLLDTITQIKEE